MNATLKLLELGQSIWLDNIQRSELRNGGMAGMIDRGEIRGVTSNPTIFMHAMTKTNAYDDSIQHLVNASMEPEDMFFKLAIEDIQETTDLFRSLYAESKGGDGYVSLEVSPFLANDTDKTIAQVKKLWELVNRPNIMIKIPATKEGIPAITAGIAAGYNINVTLIFSLKRYAEVMEAYLKGLEQRVAAGLPIDNIASVASFFVSRVDTNVDKRLQSIIDAKGSRTNKAESLLGKAAIANAKMAYAEYKKVFTGERFAKLKAHGARVQRPLWASTSTKNPAYRDVLYVEELIGPDTVDTIPPQTLTAFLDHGIVRNTLEADVPGAAKVLADVEKLGISMDDVTLELEVDGVKSFADAFTILLNAFQAKVVTTLN